MRRGCFSLLGRCCGGDLATTSTARSKRDQASECNSGGAERSDFETLAMSRQPLAPFVERNPSGHYNVGTHALGLRPELELIIAECLMAWPPAEAEMALILAQLLGASESEAALVVFQSLRRSSAQREAISEAARVTLD